MKKYNTHSHSFGTSNCGQVQPENLVKIYRDAGYDGLVLTNHYTAEGSEKYLIGDTPYKKAKYFLSLYQRAKAVGDELGVNVLLGVELNLSQYNRVGESYPVYEFLTFGMTEEFLLTNPKMYEWTQEVAYEKLDEAGMLMVQAHPFRPKTRVADPRYEHGIEIYNGHPGHNSHNDLAAGFVGVHPHLVTTAGDDFHAAGTFGYAGMWLPDGTHDNQDLVKAVKERQATVFVTGKRDPEIVRKKL